MNMGWGQLAIFVTIIKKNPLITWEIKAFSGEKNLKIYYQHSLKETLRGYIYCEITSRI